jgi:protease I
MEQSTSGGRRNIKGKSVAILATDGVEQVEILEPMRAFEQAGADVTVLAPGDREAIRGWDHDHWGEAVDVDRSVSGANPDDYDALFLPGGVMNPDRLRMDTDAVDFVRRMVAQHKPVASICHGPWMIAEAGAAQGRRMTSYPSLRTDLTNAGATWVDEEVVVDNGLVTSRNPGDLPVFIEKTLEEIAEGKHVAQTA